MTTVYVTAPPEAAPDIAETLVEERLAACVNRVPIQSVYRWDDEIHDDAEVALLVKTESDLYDRLETRIEELHPYDVPCIERFDEDGILASFAQWRESETLES